MHGSKSCSWQCLANHIFLSVALGWGTEEEEEEEKQKEEEEEQKIEEEERGDEWDWKGGGRKRRKGYRRRKTKRGGRKRRRRRTPKPAIPITRQTEMAVSPARLAFRGLENSHFLRRGDESRVSLFSHPHRLPHASPPVYLPLPRFLSLTEATPAPQEPSTREKKEERGVYFFASIS